jgi:hypothetical protein
MVAALTIAAAAAIAMAKDESVSAANAPAGALVAPAEWLKAQPKPAFREGHTLPPLTRYGWVLDLDTRVELAEHWGYGLEWGGYADAKGVERVLATPEDPAAKCMALAAKDPRRYKLVVICSRELPKNDAVPPETWTRNAEGKFLNGQAKSMDGTTWHQGMDVVYSPAAPDSVWEEAGRLRAEPIRAIRAKCPIAIVLNGGEYGLGVFGFAGKVWSQDPAILKAKGDKPWFDYISERKARAELLIANAVRKAVPDRQLYIYYTTTGGTHRNHTPGWQDWGPGYEWMKPVSDLASSEHYYRHFNSGWTGDDLLTQALNAKGWEIANGQPLCYDWLCAGWPREKGLGSGAADPLGDRGFGDLTRYTGFLKCLYVSGMVGGNAGYYDYPQGGFAAKFPADQPPHWLRQMVSLARVHALFSGLEESLRRGDLLPGPEKHRFSKEHPAYEFPTGEANVRVLARKLKDKPEWLLAAWAADGRDRSVKTTLPELGAVTLQARACGSVYRAALRGGKMDLIQVDATVGGK